LKKKLIYDKFKLKRNILFFTIGSRIKNRNQKKKDQSSKNQRKKGPTCYLRGEREKRKRRRKGKIYQGQTTQPPPIRTIPGGTGCSSASNDMTKRQF
jgi:hypothetical protein